MLSTPLPSSLIHNPNEQHPTRLRNRIKTKCDFHQVLEQNLTQRSYTLYNTAFIDNIRFSNEVFIKNKCINDNCILYQMTNSTDYDVGFLKCIVQLNINNSVLFLVRKVSIQSYGDELKIGDQNYYCSNIMYGDVTIPITYHLIRASNVFEKLAFQPEPFQSESETMSYIFFDTLTFRPALESAASKISKHYFAEEDIPRHFRNSCDDKFHS